MCGEETKEVEPISPPSWPVTRYYVTIGYYLGRKFKIFYIIKVKKLF